MNRIMKNDMIRVSGCIFGVRLGSQNGGLMTVDQKKQLDESSSDSYEIVKIFEDGYCLISNNPVVFHDVVDGTILEIAKFEAHGTSRFGSMIRDDVGKEL